MLSAISKQEIQGDFFFLRLSFYTLMLEGLLKIIDEVFIFLFEFNIF